MGSAAATLTSMRTTRHLVVLTGIGLSLVLGRADAAVFDPSTITSRTLDNGLRVIVREAHDFPLVAIDLYVRSGSADDPPSANGVCHLLEHVVFESPVSHLADRIDGLGGQTDARTTRDFTHFSVVIGSAYFREALDALAEAVAHPNFDQDVVSREISVVIQELLSGENDPVDRLSDAAFATYFRRHPYHLAGGGTRQQLSRITPGMLAQFCEQNYTGPNMALVVVGDIDPVAAFEAAAQSVGRLSASPPGPRNRVLDSVPSSPLRAAIRVPGAGHFILLGFPAPGIAQPQDVCAVDVALAALGIGRRSRIETQLVEAEQLALRAGAGFLTQRDPGLFLIWAEVPPNGGEAGQAAILDEIRRLRDQPVAEEEIQRAKAVTLGTYTMQSETYLDQAGTLGFYEAIDTYEFAIGYQQAIQAVRAADILRVARKYLDPQGCVIVTMEPGS